MSTEWRFLIVEDKDDIAGQILDAVPSFVSAPDTAVAERRASFKEALRLLNKEKFDVLILDLKDDQDVGLAPEDISAGMAVFEQLKKTRFAAVVFYTAHPHKVRPLQTEFVRVVEKTDGMEKLIGEVKFVLDTRLPALTRHIEEVQRTYMWDFVSKYWNEFSAQHQKVDLAYLMAGRLASTLRMQAGEFAAHAAGVPPESSAGTNIHPMQMYVYPTVAQIQGGDLIEEKVGTGVTTWLVLTPTCDLVQKKAEAVLLAKCIPLSETIEYKSWMETRDKVDEINALVGDNRKPAKGGPKKVQADRYKYLPGTFFIDDCVVDFQALKTVPVGDLENFRRVATLDSPFAEAVLARFTRYFARLGTPDVEKTSVIGRLTSLIQSPKFATAAQVEYKVGEPPSVTNATAAATSPVESPPRAPSA